MNRREMLKRVVGVSAVLGAAPVVAKLNASMPPNMNGAYNVPCAPTASQMPLDVRTPAQVYADEVDTQAERFLWRTENPVTEKRYNFSEGISKDALERLHKKLTAKGLPIPALQMFGSKAGVVIDGSPVLIY